MILRRQEDSALILGENTQERFRIDIEDTKHLIHLLINQYGQVRESIVRELTSNMYDSGEQGEMHLIGMHENYLYFQDTSGGMSKHFMLNDYIIIGRSTKRSDVTKIGAMGLGRLSSLAYTNMYRVISICEGLKCEYIVFLDNGDIKINLVSEESTDEPSGTRVEIQMKDDWNLWEDAIKDQCAYFPNLRIKTKFIDRTNDSFTQNDLFIKSPNLDEELHICFGVVKYEVDWSQIKPKYHFLKEVGVGLKFDLDSGLIPTPSRESITYDDVGKRIIENRIEEFIEYLKEKFTRDFTTKELVSIHRGDWIDLDLEGCVLQVKKEFLKDLGVLDDILKQFKYDYLFPIGKLNQICILGTHFTYPKRSYYDKKEILFEEDVPKGCKAFLQDEFSSYEILKINDDKTLLSWFDCRDEELPDIKHAALEYFRESLTTWKSLEQQFIDWRLAKKKPKKKRVAENGDVMISILRPPERASNKSYITENRQFTLTHLIKNCRFIVYTTDELSDGLFTLINSIKKGILICKLNNKTLQHLMENQSISHKLIDVEDLEKKNALLKTLHANIIAKRACEISPNNSSANKILQEINPRLLENLTKLRQACTGFLLPSEDLCEAIVYAAETLGCINREVWDLCHEVERYKGIFNIMFQLPNNYNSYSSRDDAYDKFLPFIKEYYYLKLLRKGFSLKDILDMSKIEEEEIMGEAIETKPVFEIEF